VYDVDVLSRIASEFCRTNKKLQLWIVELPRYCPNPIALRCGRDFHWYFHLCWYFGLCFTRFCWWKCNYYSGQVSHL